VQDIIQRADRAGKYLFCVYSCLKFSVSHLFVVSFFVAKYNKLSIEILFPVPKQNDALWTLLACESIQFFWLNFNPLVGKS